MFRKNIIVLSLFASLQQAYAADTISEQNNDGSSNEDTIIVRATPTSQTMGTQIITAEQIKKMPTRNGTITELLKNNPNVQFANNTDSSETPGEIQPENVSFHGEKFYNNNFMIDGLSNNNVMNPASTSSVSNAPNGYNAWDLPEGGAQSYWINSELVDSVEVYDSNVSAKYGDFTGGVVDGKLKDPYLERASGRVSWRGTRSDWTEYKLDSKDETSYALANQANKQPKFEKNSYAITLNQPLSNKAGLIFAYHRQQSEIPYYHTVLKNWVNQERTAETFLLKGNYLADNGDTFRATAMYSPHASKYYKPNIQNGAYTNEGGGYRFNLEWEHFAGWGKVNTLVGYQHEQNHVEHGADTYATWYSRYGTSESSQYITWDSTAVSSTTGRAFGYIGGYGEYETAKDTLTAKQDYQIHPFKWWNTTHQLDFGWQVDFSKAHYKRLRDVALSLGTPTWDASTTCVSGDDLCLSGEQYYLRRTLYPAKTINESYTNYAVYLQDSMTLGNLEVTPGVRVSMDDFLENLNVAPRFAMSYDVFGDHRSRIFAGANRYYAGNILAYKLREGIRINYTQSRTSTTSDWVTTATNNIAAGRYKMSELDTPYSDELNIGIAQRFWDTIWTLKYVHRKGRDQFVSKTIIDPTDGLTYIAMNNNGRTQGETVSLTVTPISPIKFKYATIDWMFGANYSENKTNAVAYSSILTDESMAQKSIYKGKLLNSDEVPAFDFNTPWNAFISVNTAIPKWHLNWTQRLGYTAGYRSFTSSTIACPTDNASCGTYTGNATLYTDKEYDPYFSYDWRFNWELPVGKYQKLEVNLDITNVFNSGIEIDQTGTGNNATITYKAGRQFWLGLAYNW
ncbi:MAG: TonB-dependent receptor plug domain-containing protein [Acinetobacter sp.]